MQEEILVGTKEDCMSLEGFRTYIRTGISQRLGHGFTVRVQDVIKNNDIHLTGISITSGESNISPTIYVDQLYGKYRDGEMTVQEAEDVVLQTYYRNRTYGNVNMKRFMDWNCVRERVVFKLVNLYTNEEMLSDIPYLRFLDLALVPLVMVKRDGESVATITIHSQYMKLWGISEGELFDAARANTPKLLGYELRSMNSILCDILDNAEEEYDPDELNGICSETKMFILTNKNRIDGAVCITYPNLLHDISVKLESDLYVIPSSTHETIITPKYDDISVEDINVMIREINENIVSEKPEEVLSNHVYIYKMDEDRLTM